MFNPDSGEPLGLPRGTVRGVIALSLTATLIQQTVIGAIDPITFLGVAGPFLGFYAASRPAESAAADRALADSPLAAPSISNAID